MLYLYTNSDQTLAQNDQIAFKNTGLLANYCTKKQDNNTILLTSPGIYEVIFNADVANSTEASGEVGTQLYVNGAIYNGAEASATSSGLTQVVNIGFTALVRVKPNCCMITNVPASLTFVNSGLEATYANAAITVKRVR